MSKYQRRPYSEKKEKATCLECGKKFIKKAFNQKFCSSLCQGRWNTKMKKERDRFQWN